MQSFIHDPLITAIRHIFSRLSSYSQTSTSGLLENLEEILYYMDNLDDNIQPHTGELPGKGFNNKSYYYY